MLISASLSIRMSNNSSKEASAISVLHDAVPSFRTLRSLLRDAFGPHGRACLLHNTTGGHVTVTSSSPRLLASLSLSKPLLKLLASAAQQHLVRHQDNGLLLLLLTTDLVLRGLESALPPLLVSQVFELMTVTCSECLTDLRCPVDAEGVQGHLNIISTLLSSKPLCFLSASDVRLLSHLLLKASLCDAFHTISLEGLAPAKSQLMPGLLIPLPAHFNMHCSSFKTVLFSASLSGDTPDLPAMDYNLPSGVSLTDVVLQRICGLLDELKTQGMTLVLCQKVIHPVVKHHLKAMGVGHVERLGLETMRHTHAIAGQYKEGS